jgi:dTDP-4-amino-4,6-dideoxygalactose transaminase
MHRQQCFADLKFNRDNLHETERAAAEILNLPIFPSLSESQQQRVVSVIADYYACRARAAA